MADTCVDIDECKTGDNTCHEKHAFCHNILGAYQCECHEGFAGDGRSCDPIDHCNDPKLNECDLNAKCVNTDGTYECDCNSGFRGTGRRCININECKERMHAKGLRSLNVGFYRTLVHKPILNPIQDCSFHADCHDRDGDFYCECIVGFEGNGQECTDIDECIEGSSDRSGVKGRYDPDSSPNVCSDLVPN